MSLDNWDAVVAFARGLPDVSMASYYGALSPKVNGKAFVSPSREEGSFHVASPHDEKAVLMETDPDAFWQTAHYANWPGLLVRYGADDEDRIRLVITRAWWDKASKAQRAAFGERP